MVYAFSRDHGLYFHCSYKLALIPEHLGLPDGGYFNHVSSYTTTPIRAVWLCTFVSILPGLLDFASFVAANAVFSLTAIALDLSYIIPIFLYVFTSHASSPADRTVRRRVYEHHPEVQFKPGPFYMGSGLLGWAANVTCIAWTLFVCVIFSLPTVLPVTAQNMNYASVSSKFIWLNVLLKLSSDYYPRSCCAFQVCI